MRRHGPEILDVPLDANLPKDYVTKEELRLEAYRRLAQSIDAPPSAEDVRPLIPMIRERLPTLAAIGPLVEQAVDQLRAWTDEAN
mgnify:CR=1 FL=1